MSDKILNPFLVPNHYKNYQNDRDLDFVYFFTTNNAQIKDMIGNTQIDFDFLLNQKRDIELTRSPIYFLSKFNVQYYCTLVDKEYMDQLFGHLGYEFKSVSLVCMIHFFDTESITKINTLFVRDKMTIKEITKVAANMKLMNVNQKSSYLYIKLLKKLDGGGYTKLRLNAQFNKRFFKSKMTRVEKRSLDGYVDVDGETNPSWGNYSEDFANKYVACEKYYKNHDFTEDYQAINDFLEIIEQPHKSSIDYRALKKILSNKKYYHYIKQSKVFYEKLFFKSMAIAFYEEKANVVAYNNSNYIFQLEDLNKFSGNTFNDPQSLIKKYIVSVTNYKIYDGANMDVNLETNLNVIQERMNKFITDDVSCNIFNGVNWNKIAVTGSVLPYCIRNYGQSGFENSDIDIPCAVTNVSEFCNLVKETVEIIKGNLGDDKVRLQCNKTLHIKVLPKYLDNHRNLDDWNTFVDDMELNKYNEKLYQFYLNFREKNANQFGENGESEPALISSMHVSVVRQDFITDNACNYKFIDEEMGLIYIEKPKYTLHPLPESKLKKTFEFYPTFTNFMNHVSKFHFPCVRMYYSGDNIHMTPSCVIAMLFKLIIDVECYTLKYPRKDLVLKYAERGYSFVLNKKEMDMVRNG